MISYRELAMRVVGKPLHVPGSSPRPMAHRVTALALTAAMAAALASPAFAGWNIDMSQVKGDVTITKDNKGNVTVSVDGGSNVGVTEDKSTGNDDITITDSRNNSVDNSGSNGSDGQSDTSGSSAVTMEAKDDQQAVVDDAEDEMTYDDNEGADGKGTDDSTGDAEDTDTPDTPDDSTEGTDDAQQKDAEGGSESEDTEKTENTEDSSDGAGTDGTTEDANTEGTTDGTTPEGAPLPEEPAATREAADLSMQVETDSKSEDDDDSKAVTYESKTPMQVFTEGATNVVRNVIKIINKATSGTLNVTLNNVNISGDRDDSNKDSALTVSGSGSTNLTFKGDNTLTGGGNKSGLYGGEKTNLTITGVDDNSTLTANGGKGGSGGNGINIISGDLTINGKGTVTANGGDGETAYGGHGIYTGWALSIGGDVTVNARGGDGTVAPPSDSSSGGDGIKSSGVTISGTSKVTAIGGNTNEGNAGRGISSGSDVTVEDDAVIKRAQGGINKGGNFGDGGDGIYAVSKVFVNGGTIEVAQGGTSGSEYGTGGDGIRSDTTVEITNGTIGVLQEDGTIKAGTGAVGGKGSTKGYGIYVANSQKKKESGVFITDSKVNAEGGVAGISAGSSSISGSSGSSGSLTISGTDTNVTATGDYKGIRIINGAADISGGATVKATGGNGHRNNGIYSDSLTISGEGTHVTASTNSESGDGIISGNIQISDGATVEATATGKGGTGIGSWGDQLTISGANTNVTASATAEGGIGISSSGTITISGGNTIVNGGSGKKGSGIDLWRSGFTPATKDNLKISGEDTTVTINGGAGGSCITTTTVFGYDENTNDITADVAASNGATLTTNPSSVNPDPKPEPEPEPEPEPTPDPEPKPEPEPTPTPEPEAPTDPVTPETPAGSGSSSDGDSSSAAPAPVQEPVVITPAGVPGYTFTGTMGGSIRVNTDVTGSAIEFRTLHYKAAMHTTLGQLRQLRAQGITHVTFRTLFSTTTFAIDDLLPLGDDSAEVLLTHNGRSAKLMVGSVER